LMRGIGDDVFQATVFISNATSGANMTAFKVYDNPSWAGEIRFETLTVTGEDVLRGTGTATEEFPQGVNDWGAKAHLDVNAYYRITLNRTERALHVERIEL